MDEQCKFCRRTIHESWYIGVKIWIDNRRSSVCPGGVNFENLNGWHVPEEG